MDCNSEAHSLVGSPPFASVAGSLQTQVLPTGIFRVDFKNLGGSGLLARHTLGQLLRQLETCFIRYSVWVSLEVHLMAVLGKYSGNRIDTLKARILMGVCGNS